MGAQFKLTNGAAGLRYVALESRRPTCLGIAIRDAAKFFLVWIVGESSVESSESTWRR
jgi:hypothetical protein